MMYHVANTSTANMTINAIPMKMSLMHAKLKHLLVRIRIFGCFRLGGGVIGEATLYARFSSYI